MAVDLIRDANKQIAFAGSVPEVLAQCQALHELDQKTEGRRKLLIAVIIAAAVGSGVAFLAEMILVGFAAGIAFVVSIAAYFVLAKHDIEDRKLDAARGVLDTMGDELRKGRPVQLDIDFRAYDVSLEDRWMTLQMTLQNGVRVNLGAGTFYVRKTKEKRKYVKIKDKIHERLTITYAPPKGKVFSAPPAGRLVAHSRPNLPFRRSKVSPKSATFEFRTREMLRTSGRGGWDNMGMTELISAPAIVAAIISSYKALTTVDATGGA